MDIHSYETFTTLINKLSLLKCLPFLPLLIGLHHPLDGVTNTEYKLMCFIQLTIFLQREEGTNF